MAAELGVAVAVGVLVKLCEDAVARILPIIRDGAVKFGQERTDGLHYRVERIAQIMREFQHLNHIDEAGGVNAKVKQVVDRVVALEEKLVEAQKALEKWAKTSVLKKIFLSDPRKYCFIDIDKDLTFSFTELQYAIIVYLQAKLDGLQSDTSRVKALLKEYEVNGKIARIDHFDDDEPMMECAVRTREADEDQLFRYNRKLMRFLNDQLQPVRTLLSEPLVRPACISKACWHESVQLLKKELARGDLLIDRHRGRFCLNTFYSTADARRAIEKICGTLKAIVGGWAQDIPELRQMSIEERPSDPDCVEDKRDLCMKLDYVLNKKHSVFEGAQQAEWEDVRGQHQESMKRLSVVDDKNITWLRKIVEGRWEGTYSGNKVTVIWLDSESASAPSDGPELDIEKFAKLLAEVIKLEKLNTTYAAPIYGVTRSGRLVYGRSDKTLRQWFLQDGIIEWLLKAKMLLQAAVGLEFVHDQGYVHSAVNSENFLMFGSDVVKIADFSYALDKEDVKTLSARSLQRPVRYIAPEIFGDHRHSTQSDTFSFGVVMHEVVGQQTAYGANTSYNDVMTAILKGELPCSLPGDCPPELGSLMRECCSLHPTQRPTMRQVHLELEALVARVR